MPQTTTKTVSVARTLIGVALAGAAMLAAMGLAVFQIGTESERDLPPEFIENNLDPVSFDPPEEVEVDIAKTITENIIQPDNKESGKYTKGIPFDADFDSDHTLHYTYLSSDGYTMYATWTEENGTTTERVSRYDQLGAENISVQIGLALDKKPAILLKHDNFIEIYTTVKGKWTMISEFRKAIPENKFIDFDIDTKGEFHIISCGSWNSLKYYHFKNFEILDTPTEPIFVNEVGVDYREIDIYNDPKLNSETVNASIFISSFNVPHIGYTKGISSYGYFEVKTKPKILLTQEFGKITESGYEKDFTHPVTVNTENIDSNPFYSQLGYKAPKNVFTRHDKLDQMYYYINNIKDSYAGTFLTPQFFEMISDGLDFNFNDYVQPTLPEELPGDLVIKDNDAYLLNFSLQSINNIASINLDNIHNPESVKSESPEFNVRLFPYKNQNILSNINLSTHDTYDNRLATLDINANNIPYVAYLSDNPKENKSEIKIWYSKKVNTNSDIIKKLSDTQTADLSQHRIVDTGEVTLKVSRNFPYYYFSNTVPADDYRPTVPSTNTPEYSYY